MEISKQDHFERIKETTNVVWPIIETIVKNFLTDYNNNELNPHLEIFLRKRRGKPLLRPYLTRMAYESAGGSEWESMGSLFAATELLNISTYQSNMCFDEKHDDWAGTTANNQFIASMLSLSFALKAVIEQKGISEASKVSALALINQVNSEVYLGQFLDLNKLCIKESERYLAEPESIFIEDYLKRCRLIGSSMFRVATIGAYAVSTAPSHESALFSYLDALGLAGQILNDLADYMPDANRPYASQYGDLRMGRMTFPAYILARDRHPVIYEAWQENPKLKPHLQSATLHLINNGIASKCHNLLKIVCWRPMKSAIKEMASSISKEQLIPFTFARHYIFESRMLKYFHPKESKRRKIYNQNGHCPITG